MSALAQCDAFAFIYDTTGDPAPDVLVVLKRVLDANRNPILQSPKTTTTDSAGSFHFTLPEFATVTIAARASGIWDCPDGRDFTVPPGPSGELVPDFSLPASTLVEPPLVYVGDVLSIPKASATQDGYLSAADFVAFEAGAAMGVNEIITGAGLTGGPITDTGTISLLPVPGVAGTWANPSSITINAYGQVIAIAGVADATAPNITAILATVTGVNVTITWTTDDLSDSQVDYGTTTGYGTSTPPDSTLTQSHSVTITGLLPSQGYHYVVKSRNTATLLRTSLDNTFTTGAAVDTTPPVITLDAPPVVNILATSATINWHTNELADSEVTYSTDTSYGTPTVPPITNAMPPGPGVLAHSVGLSSLTPGQLYHYRVKSKDAAGNPAIPVTGTFTTTAPSPLLTGLVSYWKLDETSGTAFDSVTATHNDLTPVGDITTEAGKVSNCRRSSGAGGLSCADNPSFDFTVGEQAITVNAWINLNSLTNLSTVVAKWSAAPNLEFLIAYDTVTSGGQWVFYLSPDGTSATPLALVDPISVNTWYMVTAIYDYPTTLWRLRINDDNARFIQNDAAAVATIFHGSSPLTLLQFGGGAQLTDGRVDEVGIWNRSLTTAEITTLYGGGSPPTYPF